LRHRFGQLNHGADSRKVKELKADSKRDEYFLDEDAKAKQRNANSAALDFSKSVFARESAARFF